MPNSSRVLFFGVAVKAKYEGVGEGASAFDDAVYLILVGIVIFLVAGLAPGPGPRRLTPFLPGWSAASSMMMANLRSRCSLPMSSRMKGNFWTVVMMILFPSSMNRRRSPDLSAWATVEEICVKSLMVSFICLSRFRRSVMIMVESKAVCPSYSASMSWREVQAMELDLPLPAEC